MAQVHRPYQYLGSKLRALDAIIDATSSIRAEAAVLDIFTGSSVVAQAFAAAGRRVYASDALGFAAEVAAAMLGMDRRDDDPSVEELVAEVSRHRDYSWCGDWLPWTEIESKALRDRDFTLLDDLYHQVPTAWRPTDDEPDVLSQVRAAAGLQADGSLPLMTAFYAGTYFGLGQALELDVLRRAIESTAAETGYRWPIRALNAALMGAASDAVFSAGKHFAQPMAMKGAHSQTRVWVDRNVVIDNAFKERLRRIFECARPGSEGHRAFHRSLEQWPERTADVADVGLIYADPPYTAQQYSRFYHIPETLFTQRVPLLQVRRGEFTRGLYPLDRHESRFCRKREAMSAFEDLMMIANRLGAALAISYSEAGQFSGNGRMVGIEDIKNIADGIFPDRQLQVIELQHQYRQFNSRSSVARDDSGREYLMVIT